MKVRITQDKLRQIINEENQRYYGEDRDPKLEAIEKLEEILEQLDEQLYLHEEYDLHEESKYLEGKNSPEYTKENLTRLKEELLEILSLVDQI